MPNTDILVFGTDAIKKQFNVDIVVFMKNIKKYFKKKKTFILTLVFVFLLVLICWLFYLFIDTFNIQTRLQNENSKLKTSQAILTYDLEQEKLYVEALESTIDRMEVEVEDFISDMEVIESKRSDSKLETRLSEIDSQIETLKKRGNDLLDAREEMIEKSLNNDDGVSINPMALIEPLKELDSKIQKTRDEINELNQERTQILLKL